MTADQAADLHARSEHRRPGQTVECGWCGRAVAVPARGRVPSWCSSSCRHRAWEARRANRDQTAEVRVVTQTIEATIGTEERRSCSVPINHAPHANRLRRNDATVGTPNVPLEARPFKSSPI